MGMGKMEDALRDVRQGTLHNYTQKTKLIREQKLPTVNGVKYRILIIYYTILLDTYKLPINYHFTIITKRQQSPLFGSLEQLNGSRIWKKTM